MRRPRAACQRALASASASLLLAVSGCGAAGSADAQREVEPERGPEFRFFSPQGFWNRPPAPDSRPTKDSAELVAALADQVEEEMAQAIGPWISTASYSVPIYTVPKDQPKVRVELAGGADDSALQAAWRAVPLPPSAAPAKGTDRHLVVWQPHRDRLWEFWRLRRAGNRWKASWGGAMNHVSRRAGNYGPEVWPGASSNWGASASSLSIAGGLIRLEDLERQRIPHALALSLPQVRKGVAAGPAKRTDGRSLDPLALPEGAHLQLDPRFDLSAARMPPLTRMIAAAAQRYGIFIRDGAADVTFYGQAPPAAGPNPYLGDEGYFEGETPMQLLASFPWRHLRVLRAPLHSQSELQP